MDVKPTPECVPVVLLSRVPSGKKELNFAGNAKKIKRVENG
jgi:hypothetical protein